MENIVPQTTGDMLSRARNPSDPAALAFSGVIGNSLERGRRPLVRGLSEARFQRLINEYFHDLELSNGADMPSPAGDEFADLLALLLESRAAPDERRAWLAHAIASATMGENHLWQDMGLPARKLLTQLMRENFPALAAKNTGDMKWKKFFYRQICERAEVPICKAPHCAECCDYGECFGGD